MWNHTWTENSDEICYESWGNSSDNWCGAKDECMKKGMALPIFNEATWSRETRAVLYLIGLLYSFLGISIVADIFMCAIEKITSKTRKIHVASSGDDDPQESIEVPVWNGTVANLTLMALGSSAPEILLAIIGIVGNNFESDKLGPSTIVGSAAFNLLAISAVCVSGIPSGQSRSINQFPVFLITSMFSIFAYVWLLVVLMGVTPGRVDVWEAVLTFLFFPILVVIAYSADKGWLNKLFCQTGSGVDNKQQQIELGGAQTADGLMLENNKEYFKYGRLDKNALFGFIKDIKKNTKLSDEDAAVIAASKVVDSQPKSRMWYRIGATRNMTGGRKIQPVFKNRKLKQVYDAINEDAEMPNIEYPDSDAAKSIIDFHASSAAVLESIGTFKVLICRHGKLTTTVRVRVETIDGSATEGEDFKAVDEVLTFLPNETEKLIEVTIIDDNQWEPDEEFFLKLSLLQTNESNDIKLGRTSIMEIMILNDDEPGTFQFEKRGHLVKESCGDALLSVIRQNGADGDVEVKWRTVDKTAINGRDYRGGEGVLEFKHGETQRDIKIAIIDDMELEKDENFEVEMYEASNGAKLGRITKTAVTVTNDDEFNSVMVKLMSMTNANVDEMRVHNDTWAQQIKDAMVVNGGDIENASVGDYVMHFLTFGFKLIFSIIPPPGLAGGWPCFVVSLIMIGGLVIIVGDLAGIFGCLVYLKDEVTAITFVALGTSLPDTFASKAAAVNEKYADNAIGNITGSNSVNVFMGLGIPWIIAAIYHAVKGTKGGFKVDAETLPFSVILYTICAILGLGLILLRRFIPAFGKSELGGPNVGKYASSAFLVTLWILYVVISSLQTYGVIKNPFSVTPA